MFKTPPHPIPLSIFSFLLLAGKEIKRRIFSCFLALPLTSILSPEGRGSNLPPSPLWGEGWGEGIDAEFYVSEVFNFYSLCFLF
jgi:hypothetical protein